MKGVPKGTAVVKNVGSFKLRLAGRPGNEGTGNEGTENESPGNEGKGGEEQVSGESGVPGVSGISGTGSETGVSEPPPVEQFNVEVPEGTKEIPSHAFANLGSVKSVTIPASVTEIGDGAFAGCTEITDVTVPEAVLELGLGNVFPDSLETIEKVTVVGGVAGIGDSAFEGCSSLTDLEIPDGISSIGNRAFLGCGGLADFEIPDGVGSIGDYAFFGCGGLTSVAIPGSVTNIGCMAFGDCRELTSIDVSEGNPIYKSVSGLLLTKDGRTLVAGANGDVVIPDGVVEIGDYAFYFFRGLESVAIPGSVSSIGAFAFRGCSEVGSLTIPECVSRIAFDAFDGCSGIKRLNIGQAVLDMGVTNAFPSAYASIEDVTIIDGSKRIPANAFARCAELKSVNIPSSVSAVEAGAFERCYKISSIVVPQSVLDFGLKNLFPHIVAVADVTILDSATRITSGAFDGCKGICSLAIGSGITNIDAMAFSSCRKISSLVVPQLVLDLGFDTLFSVQIADTMESVTILDGATNIPDFAFSSCVGSLGSVTIPAGVTNIGQYAFFYCDRLAEIDIPESVVSIGYRAFCDCKSLRTITIPDGVAKIRTETFAGCKSLESLAIGAGVDFVAPLLFDCECRNFREFNVSPDNAVYRSMSGLLVEKETKRLLSVPCGLARVNVPEGVRQMSDDAFLNSHAESVHIPASVTNIEHLAFLPCLDVVSFTVAEGNSFYSSESGLLLNKAKNLVISGPKAAESAVIPESVTRIGEYAFSGASSLLSVYLPDGLKEIGGYAFENCTGLTEIEIPAAVEKVNGTAFKGCSGIRNVTISKNVLDLGVGKVFSTIRSQIENLTIVGDAEKIPDRVGDKSFRGFSNLKRVTVSAGIRTIGREAFEGCTSLEEIELPESVESIGSQAFYNCPALRTINVPRGCQVAIDAFQTRNNGDWDGDGLSDARERELGLSPYNVDTDGDGLSDGLEVQNGLDPTQPDSDGDGMNDGWEYRNKSAGFDPGVNNATDGNPNNDADADPDGDGLTNKEECEWGTNPSNADSDGDGVSDGDEVRQNSDPTDPNDRGKPNSRIPVSFYFGDPSGSHSEKYRLKVTPVTGYGEKPSSFEWLNENYGKCETKKAMLKPGWKYEVRFYHAGTDPKYDGIPRPDYDYQLVCDRGAHSGRVIVVDDSGLFDGCFDGGKFTASGKVAYIYVIGKPVLVFDYDRDGEITDAEADIARTGEKTFRFWLNNDHDSGDVCTGIDYNSDMPGFDPNSYDGVVNGRRDLEDFTPVWIDMRGVFPPNAPRDVRDAVKWELQSYCVNAVWTSHSRDRVGNFVKSARVGGCGPNFAQYSYEAGVTHLKEGVELPDLLLEMMEVSQNRGVVFIEGACVYSLNGVEMPGLTLRAVDRQSGEEILRTDANLKLSTVDEMMRWLCLRHVAGDNRTKGQRLGIPSNRPDSECDGKNIVFVHGFNVNPDEAVSTGCEMFKRLWQSGCDSMFTVVDWYGDEDQWNNFASNQTFDGTASPDYYGNVLHAFQTAKSLATETAKIPGKKVFIAHSLGNVLTSAAIKDWKLEYSRYFMLNAAVAMEAYDETVYEPTMIDPVWTSVINTKENYLASRWSRLFEESHGGLDFRRSLSWKGRFAGIKNAVNCYSTTEDVTGNIDTNKSLLGWTVWAKQERLKGSALWHVDTVLPCGVVCEGGWGVNSYYAANPLYYNVKDGFSGKVKNLTREDAIQHPLFTPFRAKEHADAMHSTNLFTIDDENKRYALRARFLGDAIPAESFAAGANAFSKNRGPRNISLMDECMGNENIWPEDRRDKIKGQPDKLKWHHSDWKQLAYCFVYKLFDKITKNDGGN